MTTELEKQFFDTFGIEPKPLFSTRNGYTDDAYLYPQITDRILLELRGLSNHKTYEEYKAEELKKVISIMSDNPYKKSQVQALFKE